MKKLVALVLALMIYMSFALSGEASMPQNRQIAGANNQLQMAQSFAGGWTCQSCGRENNINRFCPACGAERPSLWICDNCKSLNSLQFCEICGCQKGSLTFDTISFMNGSSMDDEIQNGDLLAFKNVTPKELARFDIVENTYPGREDTVFTKRLIGLPGDTIKLEDGFLYINGEMQKEAYINDEYRVEGGSNGKAFQELLIPQKGDILCLDYTDENRNRISLFVNDEPWRWRGISSEAVADDGSRLVYNHDGGLFLDGEDISANVSIIVSIIGKKFRLEKDLYFVMGDHRNNSNDSRAQGPISEDMIYKKMIGHWRLVSDEYKWIEHKLQ